MAASRDVSQRQPCKDETTQYETSSKIDHDEGSDTLFELEKVLDKVTHIEKWVNHETEVLDSYIHSYQTMKKRFEEDILKCKLQLLKVMRKQEEKMREMKKLNLLIFEAVDERIKRTDEESKKIAEDLCEVATNEIIPIQWATQLDDFFSGMFITRVRFFTEEDKEKVLGGVKNLFKMGIFIDQDLTRSEVRMKNDLHEMADEERADGKEVHVSNDTVRIDGKYHTSV